MLSYKCVAADPPWKESGGGRIKRGADRHYQLLSPSQIVRVINTSGVWAPDPEGCHLWLWVTDNHLRDGLLVMDALGFRYVRMMCWVKASAISYKSGRSPKDSFRLDRFGLGQYMRGQHELCLFGVAGKTMKPPVNNVRSVVVAPTTDKHSEKPQAAYDAIERVSPAPRLEMFARAERPGWDVWGPQEEL